MSISYEGLLQSVRENYLQTPAESGISIAEELDYIEADLAQGLVSTLGNVSDSLGLIATIKAVAGIGTLLRGDKSGWADIGSSMSYRLWNIKLARQALKNAIAFNPNRNLPELRVEFSPAAGLLLHAVSQGEDAAAGEMVKVLEDIFFDPAYLNRETVDNSIYERFALNVYYFLKGGDTRKTLAFNTGNVYKNLLDSLLAPDFDSQLVVDLCDYHCDNIEDRGDRRPEFCSRPFDLLPVEVLAIYRIRRNAGLETPAVDHPLLNPLFTHMPDLQFENDELIDRIEAAYLEMPAA
ncbi:hypothetical protein FKG94_22480 [Exilibacterium tricleocarpae]|uniref:Uncharacterized protein n=1 Tax=Exilibacterium tricleocarpae TaxID=2591008 RepID=A0A545SY82_9GAMM|nr:hypothetical protein [Exilibacterium tricleocarpae]TQV69922.1 hypothetical protein FKG94_22480 [Exilibacterium tricleocarpae]